MDIVLASGSPRRFELLKMMGIDDFEVIADDTEEIMIEGLAPEAQVKKLSLEKASNVALLCNKETLIIAADTLVYLDGRPLGKPDSKHDAEMMLKELSGRKHSVYTGVTLLRDDRFVSEVEKTDVYFRDISNREVDAYVETGEPMDKAGSYAAQGGAAVFIERIDGDFFNVMGLPLCRLSIMLKEFDTKL